MGRSNLVAAVASLPQGVRTAVKDLSRRIDEGPRLLAVGLTLNSGGTALPTTPTLLAITNQIRATPRHGRRYRLCYGNRAMGTSGAIGTWRIYLHVDGASPGASYDKLGQATGSYGSCHIELPITGDGLPHTYQLMGTTFAGATVNVHDQMAGSYFYIEDMGKTP